jgi:hypothetical protein
MRVDFFTFGGRKYINNAFVSAHALEFILKHFGDVTDFKIKFQKPFFSNADFDISVNPLDGYFVGNFKSKDHIFYFSYTPTGEPAKEIIIPENYISTLNIFTLSLYVMEENSKLVIRKFTEDYGPMTENDKNIFVIQEIPDTSIFSTIIKSLRVPELRIEGPTLIGERRYKSSIYLNDTLLGYRYNTVKKFKI